MRSIVMLLLLSLSLLLLVGCRDDDSTNPNGPADFSGQWTLSVTNAPTKVEATLLQITQNENDVSGWAGDEPFTGVVSGDSIHIVIDTDNGDIYVQGALSSNTINGVWTMPTTSDHGTFSASRGWAVPIDIDGDWTFTPTNSDGEESDPMHLSFDQWTNSTGFFGTLSDFTFTGDCTGGIVSFDFTEADTHYSITGQLTDGVLSGDYEISNELPLEHGTWTATRGWATATTYHVFGGDHLLTGANGYNPEDQGFTDLGSASGIHTFGGAYPYYCVVVYPVNIINVDALQLSNGDYVSNINAAGNTENYFNATGAPDGEYAGVGALFDGSSGGYLCINASEANSTSLKVIASEPTSKSTFGISRLLSKH